MVPVDYNSWQRICLEIVTSLSVFGMPKTDIFKYNSPYSNTDGNILKWTALQSGNLKVLVSWVGGKTKLDIELSSRGHLVVTYYNTEIYKKYITNRKKHCQQKKKSKVEVG